MSRTGGQRCGFPEYDNSHTLWVDDAIGALLGKLRHQLSDHSVERDKSAVPGHEGRFMLSAKAGDVAHGHSLAHFTGILCGWKPDLKVLASPPLRGVALIQYSRPSAKRSSIGIGPENEPSFPKRFFWL